MFIFQDGSSRNWREELAKKYMYTSSTQRLVNVKLQTLYPQMYSIYALTLIFINQNNNTLHQVY